MIDHKIVIAFKQYLDTLEHWERLSVVESLLAYLRMQDPAYRKMLKDSAEALAKDSSLLEMLDGQPEPTDLSLNPETQDVPADAAR